MVPRTLLIADDDPALEGLVQGVLPDCRVVGAEGGAGGGTEGVLAALHAHRPPVVALSVAPPDGLDALSRILNEAPSTKVIALAPADQRLLAVRAVARGAHEVCGKPVDARELAAAVQRAFQRADLEQEGRRLNGGDAPPTLRTLRDETERRALIDALARSGGNLSAAARLLGISRPTLYSLLRQHGIRTD